MEAYLCYSFPRGMPPSLASLKPLMNLCFDCLQTRTRQWQWLVEYLAYGGGWAFAIYLSLLALPEHRADHPRNKVEC